jgi:hypothetical protein
VRIRSLGLETEYVRPDGIRIEWQLYELDSGELPRCPPKDDSYRTGLAVLAARLERSL